MLYHIITILYTLSSIGNIPYIKLKNSAHGNVEMPAVGLGTIGDIPTRSAEANPEYWNNSVGYNASIKWFNVGGRSWDSAVTYESAEGIASVILNVTVHGQQQNEMKYGSHRKSVHGILWGITRHYNKLMPF